MGFSDYLENYVLDLIFGQASYWQPWISVGLSTTNPGDDEGGLNEPISAGYERVLTSTADWSVSFLSEIVNAYEIEFNPAIDHWGTITHFALFDEDYYGVMLAYGALTSPIDILSGYIPSFDIGELVVRLD